MDKATEEFGIIVEAGYKDRKDLLEEIDKKKTDIARLQKELQTKDSEKEAKDEQLQKQQEENRQLKLQALANKTDEEQADQKKNGKKKGGEKLPKKPTNPKTEEEVDDFRKRLKEAGDNRKTLRSLQDEFENKHHLKKWVSGDLEEAIKNAEERKKAEEKHRKEALEAKKETNELKQALKNAENVKQLKQVIMAFLDNAERRLNIAAKEFEDTESFVKGIEDAYGSDSEQTRKIAQKNASGSFVHTVSALQKNVIEAWEKIAVILKPKALPGKVLEEVTADEEEKKINREAERRKRAVVQEKDAEIVVLRKRLEEMEKKLKQQAFDAKIKQHMRGRTEMNLSSKANGSPLYNLTDISDVPEGKERGNGRYSTPYETPGTNKLRGRYAQNGDNYSLDDSRRGSVSYSQTFRKRSEDSDLPPEKYTESAMKSDKTFEGFDKTQQMSFADQHYPFGSVLKAVDEIREDDKEHMLPKLREIGQQMLDYLNSDYWKNDVMWDNGFETQNKSVKEAIRRLLEYIEKKNKRTSWLQKSVTEKKLKTAKAETKTRSRFSLSTTATDKLTEDNSEVVQEFNQKFNSENSGLKTKETEKD